MFVIHTAGPIRHGGNNGEPELLAICYQRSIEVAADYGVRTIAFPSITGVYGYPIELDAQVAIQTVQNQVEKFPSILEVVFCCFSDADRSVYERFLK